MELSRADMFMLTFTYNYLFEEFLVYQSAYRNETVKSINSNILYLINFTYPCDYFSHFEIIKYYNYVLADPRLHSYNL